jgi:hypothetical protein
LPVLLITSRERGVQDAVQDVVQIPRLAALARDDRELRSLG